MVSKLNWASDQELKVDFSSFILMLVKEIFSVYCCLWFC